MRQKIPDVMPSAPKVSGLASVSDFQLVHHGPGPTGGTTCLSLIVAALVVAVKMAIAAAVVTATKRMVLFYSLSNVSSKSGPRYLIPFNTHQRPRGHFRGLG